MKDEIMQDPLRFVNIDPAYTRTLLDQRAAGKKLALITNSDWVRRARACLDARVTRVVRVPVPVCASLCEPASDHGLWPACPLSLCARRRSTPTR